MCKMVRLLSRVDQSKRTSLHPDDLRPIIEGDPNSYNQCQTHLIRKEATSASFSSLSWYLTPLLWFRRCFWTKFGSKTLKNLGSPIAKAKMVKGSFQTKSTLNERGSDSSWEMHSNAKVLFRGQIDALEWMLSTSGVIERMRRYHMNEWTQETEERRRYDNLF